MFVIKGEIQDNHFIFIELTLAPIRTVITVQPLDVHIQLLPNCILFIKKQFVFPRSPKHYDCNDASTSEGPVTVIVTTSEGSYTEAIAETETKLDNDNLGEGNHCNSNW